MIPNGIPRSLLYGERDDTVADRFIHIETIACRSAAADWTIRPHAHAALDHLFVVTEGGGELRADGQCMEFGAAMLMVPAGVVHGFRFDPGTVGHVVTVAEPLMRAIADGHAPIMRLRAAVHVLPLGDWVALAPTLEGLAAETESMAPLARLAGEALLRTMLVAAARRLPADEDEGACFSRRSAMLVTRYRAQIARHLREGWSVAQHARALGTSTPRLRAACAEIAGMAPIRILHERVLAEARRQLSYTDRTIAEIAYDLGFEDPAYFSRFFRRGLGLSPAGWRTHQAARESLPMSGGTSAAQFSRRGPDQPSSCSTSSPPISTQ